MEDGETLMLLLFSVVLIGFIFSLFWGKHLHIDYSSFFKEGFKKLSNLFGVYCYTGKQGTGKTYSAVKFVNELQEKHNYKIINNLKSLTYRNNGVSLEQYINNKENYKNITYIYEKNIFKIIKYCTEFKHNDENILIFFDEIFTALKKMGVLADDVLSFLSQMRKRGIVFVTTAQEWSEINITFRRYVRYQISCKMYGLPFFKTAYVSNEINDGDLIHWDNDSQDFIAPTIQTNFSKGLKDIILMYDTYETIDNTQKMNS